MSDNTNKKNPDMDIRDNINATIGAAKILNLNNKHKDNINLILEILSIYNIEDVKVVYGKYKIIISSEVVNIVYRKAGCGIHVVAEADRDVMLFNTFYSFDSGLIDLVSYIMFQNDKKNNNKTSD